MVSSKINNGIVSFDSCVEPQGILPIRVRMYRVRVDLGVMAIKEYSTFAKALVLEPYHHIYLNVMQLRVILGWGIKQWNLRSKFKYRFFFTLC